MSGKPVIFDNGSGVFKAGLAGDEKPRISFPCVVGRPKGQSGGEATTVGQDAWDRRGELDLTYPNVRGVITNWEDMEKIWKHAFEQLKVEPKNQKVLVAEVSLNPKADREKIMTIFCEKFNVPAMYLANQSVLALYAAGQQVGTVVDCGDGITQVVPCNPEGFAIPSAVLSLEIGGRDLDEKLWKMLEEKGNSSSDGRGSSRAIKEELCYVALDFDAEMNKGVTEVEKTYSGQIGIKVAQERFRCPEALFQPSLTGIGTPGIHQLTYDAIMKVEEGIRKQVQAKIVVAGGGSLFPGFTERFTKEFTKVAPDLEVTIISPPTRKDSTFIGGSILASLPTFESIWATRKEYDQKGAGIVHTKCD